MSGLANGGLRYFHWEIKGRFRKRVVLANVPSYPRSGFRSAGTTLVPPFWKPPSCQPPILVHDCLQLSSFCIEGAPSVTMKHQRAPKPTQIRSPISQIGFLKFLECGLCTRLTKSRTLTETACPLTRNLLELSSERAQIKWEKSKGRNQAGTHTFGEFCICRRGNPTQIRTPS